jgi:hypothetical protein
MFKEKRACVQRIREHVDRLIDQLTAVKGYMQLRDNDKAAWKLDEAIVQLHSLAADCSGEMSKTRLVGADSGNISVLSSPTVNINQGKKKKPNGMS